MAFKALEVVHQAVCENSSSSSIYFWLFSLSSCLRHPLDYIWCISVRSVCRLIQVHPTLPFNTWTMGLKNWISIAISVLNKNLIDFFLHYRVVRVLGESTFCLRWRFNYSDKSHSHQAIHLFFSKRAAHRGKFSNFRWKKYKIEADLQSYLCLVFLLKCIGFLFISETFFSWISLIYLCAVFCVTLFEQTFLMDKS